MKNQEQVSKTGFMREEKIDIRLIYELIIVLTFRNAI